MENLEIYEKARQVPKEAKKSIVGGRLKGMTDINPMWRIKTLTELFGMVGFGWYYDITHKEIIEGANNEKIATIDIDLFVKIGDEWSKPIKGTGGSSFISKERNGLYTSDEAFKMALTDALSVSCKAIGIGADVYFERDVSSKYNQQQSNYQNNRQQLTPNQVAMNNLLQVIRSKHISNPEVTEMIKDRYKKQSSKELTLQEIQDLQKFIASM